MRSFMDGNWFFGSRIYCLYIFLYLWRKKFFDSSLSKIFSLRGNSSACDALLCDLSENCSIWPHNKPLSYSNILNLAFEYFAILYYFSWKATYCYSEYYHALYDSHFYRTLVCISTSFYSSNAASERKSCSCRDM